MPVGTYRVQSLGFPKIVYYKVHKLHQRYNPTPTPHPYPLKDRSCVRVEVDMDSSAVRAPDSWSKGHGFKSQQERWENFLIQGQLPVLISVSVPHRVNAAACKRSWSFCQKCRWRVTAKHTCTLYKCWDDRWQVGTIYSTTRYMNMKQIDEKDNNYEEQ